MTKIFITLVSEQTIPNLQYIKELGPFDFHYFLSTIEMESKEKSKFIKNACSIRDNAIEIVKVNQESYTDIINKLKSIKLDDKDEIIINCTLGTKVMSIALFDFFKSWSNSKVYYTPIRTNKYKEVLLDDNEYLFKYTISVNEYFECYGIPIVKSSDPIHSLETAERIKEIFLSFNNLDYDILDKLRPNRDSGIKILSDNNIIGFLNKLNYPHNNSLSKYDVQYLTGGWFEEWVYFKIIQIFKIQPHQIALGVNVVATALNDLDVVFIKNNDLFVIECKSSLGKDLQQATLYKSGALIEKFGSAAKSLLFTMQNLRRQDGKFIESIELRARQQNVIIKDQKDLLNIDTEKFKL